MGEARLDFRILGPLEVLADGRDLTPARPKQRALLALLLLRANEIIASDELIEALWGGEPPHTAQTALHGHVSALRKLLGRDVIETRPPGYLLRVPPEQIDIGRLQTLIGGARAIADESDRADQLRAALDLFRGEPLADFRYEDFATTEAQRLEELRLAALEERIEADLAVGRQDDLIVELKRLVADNPTRERLWGQLMLALYRAGRQAEALQTYQDARRVLAEELGLEPGPALKELERKVLAHDPDLAARPRLEGRPATTPESKESEQAPGPLPSEPARAARPHHERKLVTILFCELAGVAGRSEQHDPEDLQALLESQPPRVRDQIERFGGALGELIGGAIVAVFGTPAAHEDDAERAVRAALAIRRSITESGEDLRVRMGVSTGVALVSLVSRPEHEEPIAAGDVVNTARRIQAAAPVNGILVGERTYRATRDAIEYREAVPVEAEAGSKPIQAWEALEARSRFGFDLRRKPIGPLVGRRRELNLLRSALARVRAERSPELVTLIGVPGIGKSRLVSELSKAVGREREPITWRQGRCLPYGDGVSFWALGETVKAQAGILESDSPEHAEKKLRRAVAEVITEQADAAWVEERLRPLVGAAGELRLGERSREAFAAWRRFLEALADMRPLVLVFEDLHWADEGLLDFVDELADRTRDAPLLLLCTARPELLERRPGWGGGKANALTISLRPLSDNETARVVTAVLEQPVLEAEVQEALLARAAGNPFYAEQFARVFAEIGTLDDLPETVHGVIAARLDGLLAREKALLHDAAVVGKVFWVGALEAIGEISRRQAEELLYGLERKEFVQRARRSSVAGETEYAFRHVLLRDVAYGQIPRADRGERHRRAAAWIEPLGRPEDHAEMLAHHCLRALEYTRAAGGDDPALAGRARLALRGAADRALALSSYPAAARYYSAALELWPENDPDRVWLLVHAGRARYAADRTGIDLLEQGFEELRSRGDADGAAEVAIDLSRCAWFDGQRDEAYSYLDQALELAERADRPRARAQALVARAAYHFIASQHRHAIRLAREALPVTERLGMHELRVRALDVLGAARTMSGDPGGLDDSRRAIALASEKNAFFQRTVAEWNLQAGQAFLGQLDEASATLSAFGRDVERYGTEDLARTLRNAQAYEAVLRGRWDEATRILDEMIGDTEAATTDYRQPACRALRASIELGRGDLAGASAESEKALDRARKAKDPQILAPALALRGIVQLAVGLREEASRLASEVLALGPSLIDGLLTETPAATPVEFTWLIRDLGREAELLPALESGPSTPWVEAARAIARGDLPRGVELVAQIGAPSVEAYTRLRAAEELARIGSPQQAHDHLGPALDFFRKVGATRYLAQAEQLFAVTA
jgi:DNA-binding SARP family transcriptional activator/class 3 adenylate cyclase